MRCFEILINGKRVALIGDESAQRLTACIETNPEIAKIDVAVVELVAELPIRDRHITYASWPDQRLKAGDELTLRVVDVASADVPATVVSEDLGQISEQDGR